MDYRYGKLVANDELVLLLRGADMTKYGSDIGARMRGYVHYFLTVQLGNSFVTRELEQIKKSEFDTLKLFSPDVPVAEV